jgi:hypothetical protein
MLLSPQSDIRRMLAKFSPAFTLVTVAILNVPQTCWAAPSPTNQQFPNPLWLALCAGGIIFFLVLVWARRQRKRTPAVASGLSMASTVATVTESPAPKVTRVEMRKDRPIAALKPRNGVPATSLKLKGGSVKNTNGAQRKRSFDYNRYFTDLMSSVYSQTYSVENSGHGRETEPAAAPAVNGNGHAGTNGFSGMDLIASQKSLIEEQRRLIQEQSKLIEEKTRLIAEKNHVLKIQSEFIENKVL